MIVKSFINSDNDLVVYYYDDKKNLKIIKKAVPKELQYGYLIESTFNKNDKYSPSELVTPNGEPLYITPNKGWKNKYRQVELIGQLFSDTTRRSIYQDIEYDDNIMFDIEVYTHNDSEFCHPKDANYPISVISLEYANKGIVLINDNVPNLKNVPNADRLQKECNDHFGISGDGIIPIQIVHYKDEESMLTAFITFVKKKRKCLIGWNISGFDIPYIGNRLNKLGILENFVNNETSVLEKRKVTSDFNKNKKKSHDDDFEYQYPSDITFVDLMVVFKKLDKGNFTDGASWKLDYVSSYILGDKVKKIEHYGSTLDKLCEEDPDTFLLYSMIDSILLKKIICETSIMGLYNTIMHESRASYGNNIASTNITAGLLAPIFWRKGITLAAYDNNREEVDEEDDSQYEGAYVKPPRGGIYEGVACFDFSSLYPMTQKQFQISPELFVEKRPPISETVKHTLMGDEEDLSNHYLKANNLVATPNGTVFRKERSVAEEIITKMFAKRKEYKKLLKQAKNEHNFTTIKDYDNRQLGIKWIINSMYGSFGAKFVPWYNVYIAEAITTTGKYCNRTMEKLLLSYTRKEFFEDAYIKEKYAPKPCDGYIKDYDSVLAMDTDSCYSHLGVLKNYITKNIDVSITDFILDIYENSISKIIDDKLQEISRRFNCFENSMNFEMENISSRVLFLNVKKKYIKEISWEDSGERFGYLEKLSGTGMEFKKPKSAKFSKTEVFNFVKWIFSNYSPKKGVNTRDMDDVIYEAYKKFKDIATSDNPSDICHIKKLTMLYHNYEDLDKKGITALNRGALYYNNILDQAINSKRGLIGGKNIITNGVDVQFYKSIIRDGSKILYVCFHNGAYPSNEPEVLSRLPKIDLNEQFDIIYLNPIAPILDALGLFSNKYETTKNFLMSKNTISLF